MVEFPTIFQPLLGRCSAMKATLRLKPGTKPVSRPRRPVPYVALSKVDEKLNRLQLQGVITSVSYSAWKPLIVVVKKAYGTIRICADFAASFNEALEQHHYLLQIPVDFFTTAGSSLQSWTLLMPIYKRNWMKNQEKW